ncbi:transcriptional regulator, ArgP, LysR family [Pseudodesulfovibrio mercurii]|uniref:Transcriptional regulator, ArgP, LysR family n=1 Tax=Pseudodesulfovibrio mercurii TaxID=641491 RepID=F0JHS3_9BACT|nr:LysR family transcriptional regulator ArgP [Pseudodesulfovibrio mercurii]EGB15309.1 transcriptional regulator, ArgP, LysR family [Pseudodesulfovibrio mercurii]
MLDYKLVEAFAAVVGEGGFEKGARVLHLTQGAVSQRVKLLEEQAGCVLLVRSSPPRPTAAGQAMLKHFRQVRRLEEDLDAGLGRAGAAFDTLAVGLNADSLATWFFPAVNAYLDAEPVLLDLSVDDQAETLTLLKTGGVLGCIADRAEPVQGCRAEYLGDMDYRLYATPSYKMKWYKNGAVLEDVEAAPILIFNRKDVMHEVLLAGALGRSPALLAPFYLPSSEQFAPAIATGRVCGMLPDQQAAPYLARGEIVDLLPGHVFTVRLHWQCWNLESVRLAGFTEALVRGARALLAQRP